MYMSTFIIRVFFPTTYNIEQNNILTLRTILERNKQMTATKIFNK